MITGTVKGRREQRHTGIDTAGIQFHATSGRMLREQCITDTTKRILLKRDGLQSGQRKQRMG